MRELFLVMGTTILFCDKGFLAASEKIELTEIVCLIRTLAIYVIGLWQLLLKLFLLFHLPTYIVISWVVMFLKILFIGTPNSSKYAMIITNQWVYLETSNV
jgi:hypothetical protein